MDAHLLTLLFLIFLHGSFAQFAGQESNVTSRQDGRIWDVIIATCDEPGSGTDAAVYLKVYYESAHEYETFNLDNPGNNPPQNPIAHVWEQQPFSIEKYTSEMNNVCSIDDFERGSRDHFKLYFKQSDIINVGLFWWPGFTFSQSWCAKWVLLLNSDTETCFEAIFNKWILHYKDPPTYATRFHKLRFADCVGPGDTKAQRRSYMRYEDTVGAY